METKRFAGGIYADCLPTGEFVYGSGPRLFTHLDSPIDLPPGETQSLFNVITKAGGFKIATKSHKGFDTYVWFDGKWSVDGRTSHGTQGHIWSPDGVLHVIEPAPHQVSSGYVAWEENGPVLTKDRLWNNRIYAWTDHGGIRVGMGDQGGLVLIYQGKHYLIEPGDTQFYRFHRSGNKLAVAVTRLRENDVVFYWFDVSEIETFPLYGQDPVQDPGPDPVPGPEMPTSPNLIAVVRSVAGENPDLVQKNTFESCGLLMVRLVPALNKADPAGDWCLLSKDPGEAGAEVEVAGKRVRVSHDVVVSRSRNEQFDTLGNAAANSHPDPVEVVPGPAVPDWHFVERVHYRPGNRPVPVGAVQEPRPVPVLDPVPQPRPDPVPKCRCDEVEKWVKQEVADSEARLTSLISSLPKALSLEEIAKQLRSRPTGFTLRQHGHDIEVK